MVFFHQFALDEGYPGGIMLQGEAGLLPVEDDPFRHFFVPETADDDDLHSCCGAAGKEGVVVLFQVVEGTLAPPVVVRPQTDDEVLRPVGQHRRFQPGEATADGVAALAAVDDPVIRQRLLKHVGIAAPFAAA